MRTVDETKKGVTLSMLSALARHSECLGISITNNASLVAQLVKNLPAVQETWVRCLLP